MSVLSTPVQMKWKEKCRYHYKKNNGDTTLGTRQISAKQSLLRVPLLADAGARILAL